MVTLRTVLTMAAAALMAVGTSALGADYPSKPIRIVVSEVGSSGDIVSRVLARGMVDSMGQQIIIDNRATTAIGAPIVAKATPDGYTLLLYGGTLWLGPLMRANMPYDPVKDFSPIALISTAPGFLVLNPTVAANSVSEFIALAKARPGSLNYASGSTGAITHLAAELFKSMARVNLVQIPYRSSGPALTDLIAGQVQVMFASAGGVIPHIRAGRLKALGVTSAAPTMLYPGLAPIAASGLPGYEAVAMNGMFAPARTPLPIIKRLNEVSVRLLKSGDAKERLIGIGVEPVGSSPEELGNKIKSEMARMGKVIRDAGIREE